MSDTSKALEALDRIFNYCEEIDLHIPEKEQTGYSMNDDVAIIREALFENQKTLREELEKIKSEIQDLDLGFVDEEYQAGIAYGIMKFNQILDKHIKENK